MISISSAIGGGIGALCANHFGVYWQLPALLGAVVAYLVCDAKQLIQAIPKAWDSVAEELEFFEWKEFVIRVCKIIVGIYAFAFSLGPALYVENHYRNSPYYDGILFVILLTVWITTAIIITACTLNGLLESKVDDLKNETLVKLKKTGLLPLLRFSEKGLLHLFFTITVSYFLSIWVILKCGYFIIPKLLRFTQKFLWKIILLIHSDKPVVAGLGVLLGGAVAHYFNDNVFVGIVSGAILGPIVDWFITMAIKKLQSKSVVTN